MGSITITQKDVDKAKACSHQGLKTKVRGFLSDLDEYVIAEVCHDCEGVLEDNKLTYPLQPHDVQIGFSKEYKRRLKARRNHGN